MPASDSMAEKETAVSPTAGHHHIPTHLVGSQDTLADADPELGTTTTYQHDISSTVSPPLARDFEKSAPQHLSSTLTKSTASSRPPRRDTDAGTDDDGDDDDEAIDDGTALGRLATASLTRSRSVSRSRPPPGIEHIPSAATGPILPPAPDGGLRAWSQVVAGWLVLFATWGYMNSFGAFQSYYTSSGLVQASPSAISWIGSIQGCLTTAVGAFTGRLLDAGLFRPTFATGAVIQIAGIFAMSASATPAYWQLMLTQGLMAGLGSGILFTPSLALVATWFSGRRGLAIGLATTGNSMGGLLYPLIVRQLLPRVGFVWTVRVMGFVNLACLLVAFTMLRSRLPPRKSGAVIDLKAFKDGEYDCYILGLFFFVWASYYTFYYIASYAIQHLGLSYNSAATLVMIINGAGLPARIVIPWLSDTFGPLNIITASAGAFAVVLWCWLAVGSIPGLYAFTAVAGLASGAIQSLMPTTIASITKRLDKMGTRLGMMFSILSIATLTGPPLGGAIGTATGGYVAPQIWAATSAVVAFGGLAVARWFIIGWDWRGRC